MSDAPVENRWYGGTPPAGGGTPPPSGDAPKIPDGLPPQFWDSHGGKVNTPELIKAYGEASAFKTQHDDRIKALPQRPEDYKLEIKLPDTVKLPEGMTPEINNKDPRIPALREFAVKHQISQDAVTALIALEAQSQIAEHNAAELELQAEMKKLGDNGPARISAIESFLKASVDKDEYQAMRPVVANALAVRAMEKLIAKAGVQQVPSHQPSGQQQPSRADLPIEQRWYK